MLKRFLVIIILMSVSFTYAQIDQTYQNKVKTMLQSSGGIEAYKVAITQMFTFYKQQYPDIPVKFWNEFEGEFLKTSMDELVSLIAPVYYRHLTYEDLNQIIAFYESPAGKKLSGSQAAITAESMSVGEEWGTRISEKVLSKLKEKGY